MTAATVRIDDAELFVAEPVGDGEPLVLVHGGWTGAGTWAVMTGPLSARYEVIAYDRRGHSASTRGAAAPDRRRHEEDLAALIEALGRGPVHLVGTSYGGLVALELAGRRPELVRSVVAHEPPAVALHPAPEMEALFDRVGAQIAAGDAAGATRRFFEEAVLGPGGWPVLPEPVRAAAIGNAETFADMLADPRWGELDTDAIGAYPGRMLITSGDTGPDWLPRIARTVARRIDAPVRVIEGAGHTPHHTHPEPFAAAIIG